MNQNSGQYDFIVQEIAAVQPQLYVFVRTLICDAEQARDVVQEVNLILWKKREEYDVSRDFALWACGIARFEVMAYFRTQSHDKHVYLDEQLLDQVADAAVKRSAEVDQRTSALHFCLKKLPEEQQQLIKTRYFDKQAVKSIAQLMGRSSGAIAKVLFRARRALLKCMKFRMTTEQNE